MTNVFDILEERGYIEQMTHPKEIKELFGKESVPFYRPCNLPEQKSCRRL